LLRLQVSVDGAEDRHETAGRAAGDVEQDCPENDRRDSFRLLSDGDVARSAAKQQVQDEDEDRVFG